jgi:hypothetical protein
MPESPPASGQKMSIVTLAAFVAPNDTIEAGPQVRAGRGRICA